MKDDIKREVTAIYDKIHKDTSNRLKEYQEGINTLEKKSKQSWGLDGIKAALFWCMCIGMALFVGRATADLFDINLPAIVWKISYFCALMPLLGYIIVFIIVMIAHIISVIRKGE
jgi:hypothetical protein